MKVNRPHNIPEPLVCLLLIAVGCGLRLAFRDVPNFAPVAAMALFAGYYFRDVRWAVATPLGVMAFSDLLLGGSDVWLMATVYTMLAAPVLLRRPLRAWLRLDDQRTSRIAVNVLGLVGVSLLSSLCFFLVTNFAVWLNWYERTPAGLIRCYAMAVPFFRYTLLGDFTFALALFGSYALAIRSVGWRVAGKRELQATS